MVDAAADLAARSATDAGVRIMEIDTAQETLRAAALLQEIWRASQPPVPANLLRAVQDSGGYVYAAYDGTGQLVAASLAFLAANASLHSHITGVVAGGRRRGLGLALKRHQRAWALRHGLATISWTSDPLVLRNVTFNSHALGAEVVGYRVDHYGPMTDGLNAHDRSDRIVWRWDLTSTRTVEAAAGRIRLLDGPLPIGARTIALPADIEALRASDPSAGLEWRLAVRASLADALDHGYSMGGVTTDGALVVTPPGEVTG